MEKTMKIQGMMCPHCQARVTKLLEAIPGVSSAQVNYMEGTAVLTMDAPVAHEVLTDAITKNGYTVTEIL